MTRLLKTVLHDPDPLCFTKRWTLSSDDLHDSVDNTIWSTLFSLQRKEIRDPYLSTIVYLLVLLNYHFRLIIENVVANIQKVLSLR